MTSHTACWRLSDCCQAEWLIQRDARGSAHTACITQQCPHTNCLQMIEEQWSPNCPYLNLLEKSCVLNDAWSFFESSLKAKNSFWIESYTGEDMVKFSTCPVNKADQSFRIAWESRWTLVEDFLNLYYKSSCVEGATICPRLLQLASGGRPAVASLGLMPRLPGHWLCSRLRPDVCDRQMSDMLHRLMPLPYGAGA